MATSYFCSTCGATTTGEEASCLLCPQTGDLSSAPLENACLLHQRYRLLAQLGMGGYSTVYQALDTQSQQVVAIKQIRLAGLSAAESIEATETFYREVRLLSMLNHPQVAHLYDHFGDQTHWYLVLKYIEGQTLETFLAMQTAQGQSLRLHEILDIALQLCAVLSYLHQRQPPIIYRDLKPGNIMRTPAGSLVLIDFGIARYYRSGQARDTQRLGSPGYAAPEQYGRAQTTAQSDIYSLGSLLSFLLSGQDPAEEVLPLRSLAPRVLEHEKERAVVAALVQRMRSSELSLRPQSCQEVATELEVIKQRLNIHESTPPMRSPTPQPSQPHAVSLSGQQQIQQSVPQSPLTLPQRTPRLSRRTLLIGGLTTVVAGAVIGIGQYTWHLARGTIITDPVSTFQGQYNMLGLVWLPDSKRIAYVSSYATVQIWDAIAGLTVFTYQGKDTDEWSVAALSPDGKRIVAVSELTLDNGTMQSTTQIWDIATNRKLLTYQGDEMLTVAWSPNGKYIAYTTQNDYEVQIWDAATGRTILTYPAAIDDPVNQYPAVWSPDGKYIASTTQNDEVQIWDAVAGHTIWTSPQQVNTAYAVAWSFDSKRIASVSLDYKVQIWDATTGSLILTHDPDNLNNPTSLTQVLGVAWSPDGKRIASIAGDNTVRVWDLSTDRTILTYQGYASSGVNLHAVIWSPDGKHIATAFDDDTIQVWKAP